VATSIGEEGLDIGEVDLIVCYDTSASPIRLVGAFYLLYYYILLNLSQLQRMGRTGRKRAGGVLVLLTEGKEYENYRKAVDNYQYMQKKIAAKNDFVFPHDLSPRILPKGIDPQPDKQVVDIPVENSQPELPRKRPKVKRKAPAKKLFMPEGVKTGFTKASRIGKRAASPTDSLGAESDGEPVMEEEEAPPLDDNEGLLTQQETDELYQRYQKDWASSQDVVVVQPPDLERSRYPERQRILQKTGVVGHGRRAVGMVNALKCMHDMDPKRVEELKAAFDPSLLKDPPKTKPFKPVRPVGAKAAVVRRETPTLGQKAGSANVETIAIDDDDEGLEITAVKHHATTIRKKLVRPTTKGKGSKKTHPACTTTTEDDDEVLRKPDSPGLKRRKASSINSNDKDMSRVVDSDADSLPDPSDLLSSFRFVGSGKKVRVK
jgi:ATP-dependent DNA helicase MPH1